MFANPIYTYCKCTFIGLQYMHFEKWKLITFMRISPVEELPINVANAGEIVTSRNKQRKS